MDLLESLEARWFITEVSNLSEAQGSAPHTPPRLTRRQSSCTSTVVEPSVIAALTAGAVSLVGVFANLWISRQVRSEARRLQRFQAQLKDEELSRNSLRELERHAELVRIRAWSVLGQLERLHERWLVTAQFDRELLATLDQAARDLAGRASDFLDHWAEARRDAPSDLLQAMRTKRHDIRAKVRGFDSLIDDIVNKGEDVGELLTYARGTIQLALAELDGFEELVRLARAPVGIAISDI